MTDRETRAIFMEVRLRFQKETERLGFTDPRRSPRRQASEKIDPRRPADDHRAPSTICGGELARFLRHEAQRTDREAGLVAQRIAAVEADPRF